MTCLNCGHPIEACAVPTGYKHVGSGRVCCFDIYKPEYARPATHHHYQPHSSRYSTKG